MKRTDITKLTEASLLRAVLERRGKPVAYKTLAELDALGRPPRPMVETMCEDLIKQNYLVAAGAKKGKAVQPTAKEHTELWRLLIEDHLAARARAQAAEADGAKGALRDLVNTSAFLKKASREARCAWTRADDDLYGDLVTQLDAWIAKRWEATPTWVRRRRKSVETLCHCFDCQEYGDGARRRDELKRKIEAGKQDERAARDPDSADTLDDVMTEEMEADLKAQRELQADVEALAAGQGRLAAQVAALLQQGGNGTQHE